ncbi:PAS domain-containing protein [Pseudomonas umsongensis]|uniref:PAS domain-containing protein n=1 Tax=Pseudomonas umsongensis TaxID=198618 RepID=UPI00036A256B|nr:PAS domain-containing protein [Pseudomonas umsongensis]
MMERPEAFMPTQPIHLMDRFPAALLELRDNGQIAHFNLAWVELMDRSGPERNLIDYVHHEDRSLWRRALLELRRRPETCFNQRLRFVHPSGELRWFEVSLKRGYQGFYLVAGDITAHKRREIALQASQRSSMSLLDSMPGLIYRGRNNRDWTMEFVSAGCLQLTGYPPERLVDNHEFTYNSLILAQDADYVWREVQRALSRQEPFELNYRIRCADQSIKHVWEKGVGIYADTREVLGIEGAIFERSRGLNPGR